jgi:outer membrane immunogenic protein
MKKILIGVVGSMLLGAAAPALAADLPARTYTKAPVVVPSPVYDWSGFYIGLNAGGGSARSCWDLLNVAGVSGTPEREGCHNATGGTVGGQIGYRWQAANWVFGVEAQGNWADFKGSNVDQALVGTVGDRSKVDAFGLFTGQVGYGFNNILLYGKGGAAVTGDKYGTFFNVSSVGGITVPVPAGQDFASASVTRWGGTVGAGVEFGFAPHWSVAVEYDHLFMGSRNVSLNFLPPGSGLSTINHISQNVDIGTVRVNYGFGGPVVAKF